MHCTSAAGSLRRNVTEAALRTIRLFPALLALLTASPAAATTANDLCAADADPCLVNSSRAVTNGSIIDVGARTLRIGNNGTLAVGSGAMTLRGAAVRVDPGGRVTARGTADSGGGRVTIEAGSIDVNGLVDLNGAPGGIGTLTATGAVVIGGTVQARFISTEDTGGIIDVTADAVTISGSLDVQGGFFDFGGDITITAGSALTVSGTVLANGGDGGTADLTSGGFIEITSGGAVRANATGTAGAGGDVSVAAAGALRFDGEASASGRNGSAEDGGGDGGQIALSGATLSAPRNAARVTATAGSPDGTGGDIEITAEQGGLEFQGRIDAFATGGDGSGGSVSFDGAADVLIGGTHDASGGTSGGGDVDISSGAQLTIASGATITTAGSSTGDGGDIDAEAVGELAVQGSLISDAGNGSGAVGGSIGLTACTVRIGRTGRLSSQGAQGVNTLVGRDLTFVDGTLRAGPTGGVNQIRFAANHAPQIGGTASIVPAASLVVDASVIPCSPDDATPTATRTETPTPLPSETPTHTPTFTAPPMSPSPTPPACVGDCNGDGEVTVNDLIVGVNIALGSQPVSACQAFDPDGDGMVGIGELIQGVNNALDGC
ncbi:MAG: hypothetical protein SF182_18865 [Deltaproteobacteria bacterium]|nr:hypothetical protein [Deltaproteobacteria bacterium]